MRLRGVQKAGWLFMGGVFLVTLMSSGAAGQDKLIWQLGGPNQETARLEDFVVLGPIPTDGKVGGAAFADEYVKPSVRPKAGQRLGKLTWQKASAEGGKLNFLTAIGFVDNAVAYAYAEVMAPEERDAVLEVGSDDGFRCWLNGEEVLKSDDVARSYAPAQNTAKVHLQKGCNRFLFKVVQYKGGWLLGAQLSPVVGAQAEFLNVGQGTALGEDVLDLSTHTFTYRIAEPGLQAQVPIPGKLTFVNSDKVTVRGEKSGGLGPDFRPKALALDWHEEEAGWRELEIHSTRFWKSAREHIREHCIADKYGDDVRVELPGGYAALLQIPLTAETAPEPFERGEGDVNWRCRFPVSAGENRLVIQAVSTNLHNQLHFDFLKLSAVEDGPPVKPVIEFTTPKLANIFLDGEPVVLQGTVYNVTKPAVLHYAIQDYFGDTLAEGTESLTPHEGEPVEIAIRPDMLGRGYFEMRCRLTDDQGVPVELEQCTDAPLTPFAVVVPPREPSNADWNSRFGAQLAQYPIGHEAEYVYQLVDMQYLAGTKWLRAPMFWWFYLEPAMGQFHWEAYDDRVDLLEAKGFRLMPFMWTTPNWAKAVKDDTPVWTKRFEVPTMEAWGHFIGELFAHYKDKIKYWEIINEPQHHFGMYQSKAYAEAMNVVRQERDRVAPGVKIVAGMRGETGRTLEFSKEWVELAEPDSYDVASVHYMSGQRSVWDTHQKLWGHLPQPIWDAENHFVGSGSSLSYEAAELVRGITTEFAFGVEKVFLHGGVYLMGRPHRRLLVTPAMAAHSMLVDRLDFTSHLCDLAPAPGVEGHAFKRADGTTVLVLWNTDGLSRSFKDWFGADQAAGDTLGAMTRDVVLVAGEGSPKLVDLMNNEKPLLVEDGQVHLVVGNCPVLVEGIDEQELLRASLLTLSPGQVSVAAGGVQEVTLTVANPTDRPISGALEVPLPAGWEITAKPERFQVAGHESKEFPFSVRTPKEAGRTLQKIGVRARLDDEFAGATRMEASARVTVSPDTPGTELIVDPGFRDGTKRWSVDPDGHVTVSKGILSFDRKGGGVTSSAVEVFPGESYAWNLDFRGATPVVVRLAEYDPNGTLVGYTKPLAMLTSDSWEREVGMHCIPEGVARVALAISCDGAAEVTSPGLFLLAAPVRDKAKLKWDADAVRVSKPLPITGDMARWAAIPAIKVDRFSQLRRPAVSSEIYDAAPFTGWAGPSDCSGVARVAWDDKHLYLAIRVRDDVTVKPRDDLGAKPFRYGYPSSLCRTGPMDFVQVCFDPLYGTTDKTVDLSDPRYSGHFVINFAGPYIQLELREKEGESSLWAPQFKTRLLQDEPGVKHVCKYLPDGVVYQAAIPLSVLPGMAGLSAGKEMGFEWRIWEVDKDRTRFRGFMTWTESKSASLLDWAGTSGMGVIRFVQ